MAAASGLSTAVSRRSTASSLSLRGRSMAALWHNDEHGADPHARLQLRELSLSAADQYVGDGTLRRER